MISVYHNPNYQNYVSDPESLMSITLILTAVVDTNNLKLAFKLTCNKDWRKNPDITTLGESSRGTSVGDVLVVDDRYYVVEQEGFRLLKDVETVELIGISTTLHIMRK